MCLLGAISGHHRTRTTFHNILTPSKCQIWRSCIFLSSILSLDHSCFYRNVFHGGCLLSHTHIQPGLPIYEVSELDMMTIWPQHDMNERLSLYENFTLFSLMFYHQLTFILIYFWKEMVFTHHSSVNNTIIFFLFHLTTSLSELQK